VDCQLVKGKYSLTEGLTQGKGKGTGRRILFGYSPKFQFPDEALIDLYIEEEISRKWSRGEGTN
jgi:hypothetical protein